MIAHAFTFLVVGVTLFWAAKEAFAYRAAKTDREMLVYPKSRLTRRLGNCGLILVLVALMQLDPKAMSVGGAATWAVACFSLLGVVVYVAMRDLHEASVAAVGEYRRFQRDFEDRVKAAIETKRGRERDGEES